MGENFNVGKKVQESGVILGGLGLIGFLGLIWLMIYGNLDGNLGFGQTSTAFTNEIILLSDVAATPAGAANRVNGNITHSSVTMINVTGSNINSANWTLGLVSFTTATTDFNGSSVNVSYTVVYDEAGKVNTDNVINNVTGGFTTFFTFANTWFTIAAIVLLIFMLLGLLAVAVIISRMQSGASSSSGGSKFGVTN